MPTSDTPAEPTYLGIELGSTRVKACLITGDGHRVLATGSASWENQFVDNLWTYSLDDAVAKLQEAYADLKESYRAQHGSTPPRFAALGISGMMHGYLPFDARGELLTPFRTWRNTNTQGAVDELIPLLNTNIPLRWSIAHLHQDILDGADHTTRIAFFTTLSGYIHWRLTGRKVLGIGDASGMFPVDSHTHDYARSAVESYDEHVRVNHPGRLAEGGVRSLLPEVLVAGEDAGSLTPEGALLLDPSGDLGPGIPMAPPEGDAGTGMVATNAITRRTANVSVGTSIFAMVVLEEELRSSHPEIDLVATPDGLAVAMVHCNNGASELGEWADLFREFATVSGTPMASDDVFEALFAAVAGSETDAGGLVSYNYLAGEPITQTLEGRPMFLRGPDSRFTLGNFIRSQIYGVFGTLSLGLRILEAEGARMERAFAHGGIFRTTGVAQQLLAAALNTPVSLGETASEGGAWGIAVLAAYLDHQHVPLDVYLRESVFADVALTTVDPDPADVAGYERFLTSYEGALVAQRAAVTGLPSTT